MNTIPHSSSLKTLSQAECISITFEDQKNGEKDACITQHRASRQGYVPRTSMGKTSTPHHVIPQYDNQHHSEHNLYKKRHETN